MNRNIVQNKIEYIDHYPLTHIIRLILNYCTVKLHLHYTKKKSENSWEEPDLDELENKGQEEAAHEESDQKNKAGPVGGTQLLT